MSDRPKKRAGWYPDSAYGFRYFCEDAYFLADHVIALNRTGDGATSPWVVTFYASQFDSRRCGSAQYPGTLTDEEAQALAFLDWRMEYKKDRVLR